VGLGDASVYPALLDSFGVAEEARGRILHELATRDFVGLSRELESADLDREAAALLLRVPQERGGVDVLETPTGPLADAVSGMRAVQALLPPEAASRVIFDLGLSRSLGYYTGAIFEVYDPALGAPLGGGGRYDDLLGRFGRPLPAVGFGLNVERLHIALAGEERGEGR
jgi:ATP phosphoribosyltransferase regulatory subunit